MNDWIWQTNIHTNIRCSRLPIAALSPFVCRLVRNAIVKATARAFRWRDMMESGVHATIREIAVAEKINETYVGRVLRLTLLAPDIVEAIVNGRQLGDYSSTR